MNCCRPTKTCMQWCATARKLLLIYCDTWETNSYKQCTHQQFKQNSQIRMIMTRCWRCICFVFSAFHQIGDETYEFECINKVPNTRMEYLKEERNYKIHSLIYYLFSFFTLPPFFRVYKCFINEFPRQLNQYECNNEN